MATYLDSGMTSFRAGAASSAHTSGAARISATGRIYRAKPSEAVSVMILLMNIETHMFEGKVAKNDVLQRRGWRV